MCYQTVDSIYAIIITLYFALSYASSYAYFNDDGDEPEPYGDISFKSF